MEKKFVEELKGIIVYLEKENDEKIITKEGKGDYEKCLKAFLKKKLNLKPNEKIHINQFFDILSIRITLNNGISFYIKDRLCKKNSIKKINKEIKSFRSF